MMNSQECQEAIHILIHSPFYFRMSLNARKILISDFCRMHTECVRIDSIQLGEKRGDGKR